MSPALSICLALCMGAPYTDTQGRFSVDLPQTWRLAPRFGETEGMRFERRLNTRRGGGAVELEITVAERGADGWAQAWAAQLRAAGYRTKRRSRGGLRISARRGADRVRCDFREGASRAFRICLRGEASKLRAVRTEVKGILRSFQTTAPRSEPRRDPIGVTPPPAAAPQAPSLVGRYRSAQGVELRLRRDGRFRLGPRGGTYEVQGSALTLMPEAGRKTRFTYELVADELRLSTPALERPAVYTRVRPPGPGALVGRYRRGDAVLELSVDHTFTFGKQSGKWVFEEGTLRLRHKKGDTVSYDVEVSQDGLRLSGADLDQAVLMHRSK